MISDKIKRLFQFIEFLHSNTDNFKKYDTVIDELNKLDIQRRNLKPKNNFADKLKYDEIQREIKEKFNVVDVNIITPFKNTAIELNVCDFQKEPILCWNNVESDIYNLKQDFNSEDITEILDHKSKYIGFRTHTNCTYFNNFFFSELDEILKELFDFFREGNENEFEPFEAETIKVDNLKDAINVLVKGNTASIIKKEIEKNEFVETYPEKLIKYLELKPYNSELDFINEWLIEVSDKIKEPESILNDPSLSFVSKAKFNIAEPFLIKSIKTKQKKRIANFSSIITYLEGKKNELTNTPMQIKKVNTSITDWLNSNLFFQIYNETPNGKEKNNDSIITPANWESLKNEFFNQRMEKYNIDYNVQEKIDLEVQYIDKLTFEKKEHQIIKERYKDYLNSKLAGNESDDLIRDENLHNHIFKHNAFDVWQSMFDEFEIVESSRTDVKFMFEEMKKERLIHNTVNQKTFLSWIEEVYDGLIIQKTSNHSRTQSRINAYSRAKELYKS